MGAVVSNNLRKIFRGGVEALKGVSIEVPRGSITALMGHNGAGKTTFVRIAAGLLKPTEGSVEVLGIDVVREPERVRERIALMPQGALPPSFSTPLEFVSTYLSYRGFARREALRRGWEVLKSIGLAEAAGRKCVELSLGSQQRVVAAAALASGADVVFLDEPTSGLDPMGKRTFWSVLAGLRRSGSTLVMTSHSPEEVEAIADHVAVLVGGRVVAQGSIEEVIGSVGYSRVIEIHGPPPGLDPWDESVRIGDILVTYFRDDLDAERVLRRLLKDGARARVRPVGVADVMILRGGRGEVLEEH